MEVDDKIIIAPDNLKFIQKKQKKHVNTSHVRIEKKKRINPRADTK